MISNINLKRIASKINELGGFQEGVRNFKVFNEYNIQLIKNKDNKKVYLYDKNGNELDSTILLNLIM